MKKIKDFFYDKNDIIIVLLIVAAAGFIIYTRIDAIMDYPEKYAKEMEATIASEMKEDTSSATSTETSTTKEESETTTASKVTIKITDSDYSMTVAKKLEDAELVESAEDFDNYITTKGKSSSIKSGNFQIPSNSTYEEIIDIIT